MVEMVEMVTNTNTTNDNVNGIVKKKRGRKPKPIDPIDLEKFKRIDDYLSTKKDKFKTTDVLNDIYGNYNKQDYLKVYHKVYLYLMKKTREGYLNKEGGWFFKKS